MHRNHQPALWAAALCISVGVSSTLHAQDAAPAPAAPPAPPAAPDAAHTPPAPAPDAAPEAEAPAAPEAEAPAAPEAEAPAEPAPPPAPGAGAAAGASLDVSAAAQVQPGEAAAGVDVAAPEAEPGAAAEPGETEGEGEAIEGEEEIVVTGSRIKRSSFAASAPVQIISREELEFSGAQNLEDMIQYLTVANGSGYRGGGGGAGTAQVNLRGLGAGATLVLLNGRRTAPSAAGVTVAFVDISTIPLAAVERIEILKGGASAIYGSDAIAGVVNIITRKDWQGARAQVDGRTTDRFDQREGTASVAFGSNNGPVRVSAALAYSRQSELLATDRDFTAEEGPPGGLGGDWSTRGQPGTFLAPGLMPDPACVDPETRPAGSEIRALEPFGDLCYFSFRAFQPLVGNEERASVYAYGEVDVTNHTRLFAEASVSKARTDAIGSPSFSFNVRPIIPADHVDNIYGTDVPFVGRSLGAEAGGSRSETDDDTMRTAFGLRGDFEGAAANTMFEDWEWELFGSFGVSRYNRYLPDTVVPDFDEALASCTDRRMLENCYNPFYSAVLGTGTPRSQDVIESFQGALMGAIDQHLQTYNAGMSGSLFELPGGDLGLAFGGEIRHELRTSQLDHNTNNFELLFYHGDEDGYGERNVYGGYLELVAPVYNGIELQAAGRIEEYEDAGSTANPTVGLLLTPADIAGSDDELIKHLQLRGHLSHAFRAPHLFQTFNGSTTVPGAFLPPGQAVPIFAPVRRVGNPDLEPEEAIAASAGTTWLPTKELLLELDFWHFDYEKRISQESANRLYDDVVMQVMDDPTFSDPRVEIDDMLAPQRITVTYVNLPGHVITQGIDFRVMLTLDTGDAGTVRAGVDGTWTFNFQLDRERVSTITLMDGSEFDLPFCDGDTCNVTGQLNSDNVAGAVPELRINIPLSWSISDHVVGVVAHYMTGLEDWAPSRFDEENLRPYTEIDGYFTLDASYAYTLRDVIGSATQFRLGIYNLLDQDPPFADLLNSISGIHDPRGRVIYGSITQDF